MSASSYIFLITELKIIRKFQITSIRTPFNFEREYLVREDTFFKCVAFIMKKLRMYFKLYPEDFSLKDVLLEDYSECIKYFDPIDLEMKYGKNISKLLNESFYFRISLPEYTNKNFDVDKFLKLLRKTINEFIESELNKIKELLSVYLCKDLLTLFTIDTFFLTKENASCYISDDDGY